MTQMGKSSKAFIKALETALAERGAKAEFLRVTGLSPSSLAGYLKGENSPTLEMIERIADYLQRDPVELLKPDGVAANLPLAAVKIVALLGALSEAQLSTIFSYVSFIAESNEIAGQAPKDIPKKRHNNK